MLQQPQVELLPSTTAGVLRAELSYLGNFNRDFFLLLAAFTAGLLSLELEIEVGIEVEVVVEVVVVVEVEAEAEAEVECIFLKCCFNVILLEQNFLHR